MSTLNAIISQIDDVIWIEAFQQQDKFARDIPQMDW